MSQTGGTVPTPHQFQWMQSMYDEIAAASDWPQLSAEARAERLLEKYQEWQTDPDKPNREDFSGSKEDKLQHMQRVIFYFENQRQGQRTSALRTLFSSMRVQSSSAKPCDERRINRSIRARGREERSMFMFAESVVSISSSFLRSR